MHIEVFQSKSNAGWYWHFKSKGRITSDGEDHPTKANAIRASKGVVNAIIKRTTNVRSVFIQEELKNGITKITWL